jgi:flagellin
VPVINTNNAANAALRYLNNSTSSDAKSIAELASGSRIVQASDDAAGLAISTQLQANATVFQEDTVNIQQGQSILNIADGGLAQISNALQRMMALASEAASGQVTDAQRRQDIDAEYQALTRQINAIASGAQYGGQSLLTYANSQGGFSWNSSSTLTGFYEAQVLRNTSFGANASKVSGDTGTFGDTGQVAQYGSGAQGLPTGTSGTFEAGPYEGNTPFGPTQFLTGIGAVGSISVTINTFNSQSLGLERDRVSYQDVAPPSTVQVGSVAMSIGAYLAANPTAVIAGGVVTTVQATTSNVATQSAAMIAMGTVSAALTRVANERAVLGAYESRFSFSQSVAESDLQHTEAAVSVLADADIAGVKAGLSAQDVQTQAAIAAITQASLMPTDLLKLIQS